METLLQAIQQQNALILQALQNQQVPPVAPPAEAPPMPQASIRRNEERVASVQPPVEEPRHREPRVESAAEVQGPPRDDHELPPPPPLRPQRNMLPEFIKCNRYFEGLPGKPEEAEDWLSQIERSLDVFQVPEALKVPYGSYLLRLRARIWWDSKRRGLPHPVTWEVFRREFLKEYFPGSLKAKYSTDLMNLTQGSKTIDEYEHEFNRLLQFAPDAYKDSDELKRQTFMAGLEPHFQRRLTEFEIPDFAAMVEKARVIEHARKYEVERYKKRGQTFGKRTYDDTGTNYAPKKKKFFKADGNAKKGNIGKTNVICWKCKGAHYPRNCPHLQHKCYYCGEGGHIATDCPKKVGANCFICGKKGHISTSCPQRVNIVAGPSQSKNTIGITNRKENNTNTGKTTGVARVYAMHGTPIDEEEIEEEDAENI